MRPKHIILFIACCLILLGVLSWFFPQDNSLDLHWPTLSEALGTPTKSDGIDSIDAIATIATIDTIDTIDTIVPIATIDTIDTIAIIPPIVPTDPLALFRAALAEADTCQVRVIHYGDSQIEEGRISYNIRQHLQAIYGGGGVGWVQVPQFVATKTTRMTTTMNEKTVTHSYCPTRYTVYGKASMHRAHGNHYGPCGQVLIMDSVHSPQSHHMHLDLRPMQEGKQVNYFSQIRILAQGDIQVNGAYQDMLYYPDSTTACEIDLDGQGEVYGISVESKTGVIVDNVPMRGAIGNVFTKMDAQQLTDYYAATNTRLIILQYGGNLMPGTKSPNRVYGYIQTMRKQIAFLRQCAPQASIVFIGASDMLTTIDGERVSYPYLGLLDQQLAKMAREENIGYWSLYQAMGGENGMVTWQNKGWAASDGVHFTQQGAYHAGELFWQWLEPQLQQPATCNLQPAT